MATDEDRREAMAKLQEFFAKALPSVTTTIPPDKVEELFRETDTRTVLKDTLSRLSELALSAASNVDGMTDEELEYAKSVLAHADAPMDRRDMEAMRQQRQENRDLMKKRVEEFTVRQKEQRAVREQMQKLVMQTILKGIQQWATEPTDHPKEATTATTSASSD